MKRYREYAANVGIGRTGTQTVTILASTPQEAYTRLIRLGYRRITNITANK